MCPHLSSADTWAEQILPDTACINALSACESQNAGTCPAELGKNIPMEEALPNQHASVPLQHVTLLA